jgi:RNA polymerase sigma-70 factor (ECF subfamily)
MAAKPQIQPADPAVGQNCPLPGARLPAANGRAGCAPDHKSSRSDSQSVRLLGSCTANGAYDSKDSAWLQSILDRFEGPLVRYAMRITGNLERGRDVVQETFLRLCREPVVATRDSLPQWLFTVCRRLAIDVRRKETRMSTQLENAAVCDVTARTASAPMEQGEQIEQLLRLLGGLPANQQEVVRLKFQEGMSYKEIAAITGLSVSNVGYLLHTAVKALRESVDKMDR